MSNEQVANQAGLAARESVWTERDADGKLEALRTELLRLHHRCQAYETFIHNLMQHQHGPQGQMMIPLVEGDRGPIGYRPDREPYSLKLKP